MNFLTLINGALKSVSAIVVSAGAGDSGKIPGLDATGRLDTSFMPVGIGSDMKNITASEALSAGNLVNVWNNSGQNARKADASTTGKSAIGFVQSGVASGALAPVMFEGTITGLTGLVPGTAYFLSATTPGAVTAVAPSTTGQVVQYVGTAISATELSFEPDSPIELA
jgi:hypothetical protein